MPQEFRGAMSGAIGCKQRGATSSSTACTHAAQTTQNCTAFEAKAENSIHDDIVASIEVRRTEGGQLHITACHSEHPAAAVQSQGHR